MSKRAVFSALLLAAVGLVVLRFFDNHPITIPIQPTELEIAGSAPERSDRGDVAVILDASAIARSASAGSFAALDFSCAWIDLIEGVFGPVSVVSPRDDLASVRAAVVTASAHAAVDATALSAFVERGGVVLVDAPAAGWRRDVLGLLGCDAGAERPFPERDLLPGGAVDPEDRAAFDATPFWRPARFRPLLPDPESGAALASSLFAVRPLGRGRVVGCSIDVARLATEMRQGRPARDDFTLEERFGDYPGILEPDDLVADRALRSCETPFCDLLAESVAALLEPEGALLPRLLPFPSGSRGVLLATHDEDLRGGAASLELNELDRAIGLAGTTFAIAHPRLEEDWLHPLDFARAIHERGGAVGLHWNRFPMPIGLFRVEPVQYVRPLADQVARLRDLSPATREFAVNRNHYLILRERWTGIFRALAAQGIRLDSTYGANKGRGYLFGTARPYRILDENGFPLPIRELPFVNQEDWGGADAAFFERILTANGDRHHGAIVTLFHPHLVLKTAEGRALYESIAATALAKGHLPLHFEEFLSFVERRSRSRVKSHLDEGGFSIEVVAEGADFLLGLPARGREPARLRTEGGLSLRGERVRIGARPFDAFELPPGRTVLFPEDP